MSTPKYMIQTSNFQDILPIWQDFLWPRRKSPIREKSSIQLGGTIDMSIYQRPQTLFWKITDNQQIIAVNSGHWTSDHQFRSRGLYVHENYRGQGFAKQLLEIVVVEAQKLGAKQVWSMPRLKVLPVYESIGFRAYGEPIEDNVEFGPNIFATVDL